MTKRKSRKNENVMFLDIARLIAAIAFMLLAAAAVIFVVGYIKKGKTFRGLEQITESTTVAVSDEVQDIKVEKAPEPGIFKDEEGNIRYILSNEEIVDYADENIINTNFGPILKSSWLVYEDSVYYFNDNGVLVTSDFDEKAMQYTFDSEGALIGISYNNNYIEETADSFFEYPGLIKAKGFWAFVDQERRIKDFYAIMFKYTTESEIYPLGSKSKLQYSLPYSMTIDGSYLYYLAYSPEESDDISEINGKLFRIRPGDNVRELMAENVQGYKVIKVNGKKTVVYCANDRIYTCSKAISQETLPSFDENADYIVSVEGEKAYLTTQEGYFVTPDIDEFKAKSFIYQLSEEGEIISVRPSPNTLVGEYSYSTEAGSVFNAVMSRVVRTDGSGKKEIISQTFPGEARNFHYDAADNVIYAEYRDNSGIEYVLKIAPDGTVEYLTDNNGGFPLTIVNIEKDTVVIKYNIEGNTGHTHLSKTSSIKLVSGIEPVTEENMPQGPGQGPGTVAYYDDSVGAGQTVINSTEAGYSVISNAPGSAAGNPQMTGPGQGPGGF